MKCVIALVAVLYLCHNVQSKTSLNGEIITGLEKLNKLFKGKEVSITPSDMMRVPSRDMNLNASSCVGVFVRELKQLLNNVTVLENGKHTLQEIEANLDTMGPHEENDQDCRMTERTVGLTPFKQYANFLRKLNSSKK